MDIESARHRLAVYAQTARVAPPTELVSEDGAPSPSLLTFCEEQQLTLDWALLGHQPMHRPADDDLSSIAERLTFLHALLQGLDHLIGEREVAGPTSNAAYALSQEVVSKCDGILSSVEELVKKERLA